MTKTVKIHFLIGKDKKTVEAPIGATVLKIAEANNIPITGACGGNCACGTCRIDLSKEDYKKLSQPSESEEDVLERDSGTTPTSRLSCQMTITEEMDNIHIITKE